MDNSGGNRLAGKEQRVHARSRFLAKFGQDVAVDVQGDPDVGVTEMLLYRLGMKSLAEQQGRHDVAGRPVPERSETD